MAAVCVLAICCHRSALCRVEMRAHDKVDLQCVSRSRSAAPTTPPLISGDILHAERLAKPLR